MIGNILFTSLVTGKFQKWKASLSMGIVSTKKISTESVAKRLMAGWGLYCAEEEWVNVEIYLSYFACLSLTRIIVVLATTWSICSFQSCISNSKWLSYLLSRFSLVMLDHLQMLTLKPPHRRIKLSVKLACMFHHRLMILEKQLGATGTWIVKFVQLYYLALNVGNKLYNKMNSFTLEMKAWPVLRCWYAGRKF